MKMSFSLNLVKSLLACISVIFTGLEANEAFAGSFLNAEALGRPVEGYDIASRGAGWTSIGVKSEFGMSLVNPASAAWATSPQLAIGWVNENLWVKAGDDPSSDRVGEIRFPSFHLVVPVMKRVQISLGYHDLTDGRYELRSLEAEGETNEHDHLRTGSGSLGEFFIGLGFHGPSDLYSLGVRYGVVQGTLREEFERDFVSTTFRDSKTVLRTRMEDGSAWEFGAQVHPLDPLTIGGVLRTESDLKLKSLSQTESGYRHELFEEQAFASSFGIGASYQASDRWLLSADLLQRGWDDVDGGAFPTLQTTRRIGVGVVRLPHPETSAKNHLRDQIVWRLGFTTADLSVPTSSGETVSEWAVTGGIGLPVQFDRGYIDGLIEVGRRGDVEDNGFRETFIRLGFGATFQKLRPAF